MSYYLSVFKVINIRWMTLKTLKFLLFDYSMIYVYLCIILKCYCELHYILTKRFKFTFFFGNNKMWQTLFQSRQDHANLIQREIQMILNFLSVFSAYFQLQSVTICNNQLVLFSCSSPGDVYSRFFLYFFLISFKKSRGLIKPPCRQKKNNVSYRNSI